MNFVLGLVVWCVLFVLCWPLALAVLLCGRSSGC